MTDITTDITETETAGRPNIASIARTSDVSHADYIYTLAEHAPDELKNLVSVKTQKAALKAIEEVGELFTSTTDLAIEKAIETKVAAAIKALSNTDELNGYAGREFNPENFAKKVQPKVKRERLSPMEKAQRITEKASPEQLEALAALLAARGISLDSPEEVVEG